MADKYLKIRIDEESLLQLQEVAKRSRRDTHSHVLWLIDRELGNGGKYVMPTSRLFGGAVFDEETGKFVAYSDFHKE